MVNRQTMETIGITGGTGFVGSALTDLLLKKGYRVVIYSRTPRSDRDDSKVLYSQWDPAREQIDYSYLPELDGIVHMAGASVQKRWTQQHKEDILRSRVQGTRFLVEQLQQHARQCRVFIASSAVGYYGPDHESGIPFREEDPPATDFLANVCRLWEEASADLGDQIRRVILRFGIVFGRDEGAFPRLVQPLRFGAMPIPGNGRQIMSWIHIQDLCRMIVWCLEQQKIAGVFNAVAPEPASQRKILETISRHKKGLKLPLYVPETALRLLLGEMSGEILKSSNVDAKKMLATGFRFDYPTLSDAIAELMTSRNAYHEKA